MERYFLIYGILSFLIFKKISSILTVFANIISLRLGLSNIEIYFILIIFALLPLVFFVFYIKKIKFNFRSLMILTFLYISSYFLLYYLNTYLGSPLADKAELNIQFDFLVVKGWSEMVAVFSEVILLLYLVTKALKGMNSNYRG